MIRAMKRVGVKGFTLIELMITIAIIGILAAVAIPSYLTYTDKARFTATTNAAMSRKNYVATCILTLRTATGCSAGTNGIPADTTRVASSIPGVVVANGVITATTEQTGQETYILTPTFNSTTGTITWAATGTCSAAGLC